ncbi:lysophospholipid acyltransferase [Aurantivibrio plasticivorans]
MGVGYYYTFKRRVHFARVNINICFPDLSEEEKEVLVKDCFIQAGMWFMEAGAVWLWPREKMLGYVREVNPELLESVIDKNHGVILAIPHLGNWEIIAPLITSRHQFACFYLHDEKVPLISQYIYQQRSRNGTLLAPAGPKGIRILYKHLKAGNVAGLLPDHIPSADMGVFAPFFNRDALTGTLISSLAKKNNAAVLSAVIVRTDSGFDVHYDHVENQHSDDPVLAAKSINAAIEKAIAIAPSQFQWVYPRFKKRRDPNTQSPYR